MSTQSKLLIDTELYLYQAASACEYEAEWAPDDWTYLCRHGDARAAFQDAVVEAQSTFPDHSVTLAFGDRASFRFGLWPGYKANRKKYRKPAGYRQLLEWVEAAAPTRGWATARLPDVETDDVLGILYEPGDVIVSFDKDMMTLAGLHFRNGEVVEVDQHAADLAFFGQALTGDAADNYPGCPGYGPVTATKALAGCNTVAEMWQAVVKAYGSKGLDHSYALTQARCARILRAGEYDMAKGTPVLWCPPVS